MRYEITRGEYQEIEYLTKCALSASNKAKANEYIQRLDYLCPGLAGPARNILSELKASVSNAAGRVQDKERRSYFVRMDLFKLSRFIKEDMLYENDTRNIPRNI